MKKIVLLAVLLSSLVFGADINLWKKSTLNQIIQNKELRACVAPGYMPFEMRTKRDKLIGYDIDLAKKMAKDMGNGVKAKFVAITWDGVVAALLTNKCDMIMGGMTITQKRNLKVNFTDPFMVIGQTVIIRKALKDKIKTAKDLDKKGYTIATQRGVTGAIVARKFFKKAKIITFNEVEEAAADVINGNADAIIYDLPYNRIFMSQKGKGKLIHLDKPLTYEPLGLAIRKGDPDFLNWLNAFFRQIKNDKIVDFYDKLDKKWFQNTNWLKKIQ